MDSCLQALADPRRRQLIELLQSGEKTVSELTAALPIAQSGVSRHLRILREAGMVRVRAEGQRRLYSLDPGPFEALSEWLLRVRGVWEHRLDSLEIELQRRMAAQSTPEGGPR